MKIDWAISLPAVMSLTVALGYGQPSFAADKFAFPLRVSPGAATCLPKATGKATINPFGASEILHVEISNLPPNTEFDLFVIQVPNAPFGLSWYQGDIVTDQNGVGVGEFIGRFNKETFIVAPGVAPAPLVFPGDASSNPATPPVQTYHLGLWFNSPYDAARAGCAGTVTPFNGAHNAGIQVLNTAGFPNNAGPLRRVD